MGAKSQRKGRSGELELCRILQRHGIPAEPGRAVSFGTTPDITGLPGIHCEVKRREAVNLSAALEQAQQDSERFGGLPAVFHRRNREGWRVTMALEDWLSMYSAVSQNRELGDFGGLKKGCPETGPLRGGWTGHLYYTAGRPKMQWRSMS